MDLIEAIGIFLVGAVILGMAIYFPWRFFALRHSRERNPEALSHHVTWKGWLYYGTTIFLLLAGVAFRLFNKGNLTEQESWLVTVYLVIVVLGAVLGEKLLVRGGHKLWEKRTNMSPKNLLNKDAR